MQEEQPARRSRVDADGLAYRGSMLSAQLYVNNQREALNTAILAETPSLAALEPAIEWVSPLRTARYAEYRDGRFLAALGLNDRAASLAHFWPSGGPRWDALARVSFPDREPGAILVEAKSYPGEMFDKAGCGATATSSLSKIKAALDETRNWLGVKAPLQPWLGGYYQLANRLAALYWLQRELEGRAWLVHLLFTDDQSHPAGLATSKAGWDAALNAAYRTLGLPAVVPNYVPVFLPALPRPASSR